MLDEKTQTLVHVQCSIDASNIVEDSPGLMRSDSIASLEEEVQKKEEEEEELVGKRRKGL